MKKKVLKGFTLIELIIVVAVFSLIMLGAMALVDPVSKIFRHSNEYEKTYAYVDNIQNYLQDSLKYADNLWVYQGDYSDDFFSNESLKFKNTYYDKIVQTKDGVNVDFVNCKFRLMTILNQDTEINGVIYPKGQILMNTVDYKSDGETSNDLNGNVAQLNDQFFDGKYSFDYVITNTEYSTFIESSGMSMINSLTETNVDKALDDMNFKNLAIGIVTYDTSRQKDGSFEFSEAIGVKSDGVTEYTYRMYSPVAQYTVANIPLMNIIGRKGPNRSYYVTKDVVKDGKTKTQIVPYEPKSTESFMFGEQEKTGVKERLMSMNSDDNIYILYSLCDEVNIP